MHDYQVTIQNAKTTLTVYGIKCTDDIADHCNWHVGFTVGIISSNYKFVVNFEEMVFYQFDFKRGTNEIVDENNTNKRLVIEKDRISLHLDKNETDDFNEIEINLSFRFDPEKIDDFKIELKAYAEAVLGR